MLSRFVGGVPWKTCSMGDEVSLRFRPSLAVISPACTQRNLEDGLASDLHIPRAVQPASTFHEQVRLLGDVILGIIPAKLAIGIPEALAKPFLRHPALFPPFCMGT
jgi:hypothetical protein